MNIYQKAIPASVASAVESLERKLEEAERELGEAQLQTTMMWTSSHRQHGQTVVDRESGKGPTPNAQLLHNFSKGGFSAMNGSALNRRSWVVRPSRIRTY